MQPQKVLHLVKLYRIKHNSGWYYCGLSIVTRSPMFSPLSEKAILYETKEEAGKDYLAYPVFEMCSIDEFETLVGT